MELHPKVSVIIPTCDRPVLVQRALKSVLNQTYDNFEVVVIDDGANQIGQIFGNVARTKVRYARTARPHSGSSCARNVGLKLTSGDFIAFLGDDDEWLPSKLACQIQVFNNCGQDTGVVHTNCYVIRGGRRFLLHSTDPVQSLDRLLEFDFVIDITALIRRECFEVVGNFDERLFRGQDWDLYLRIARHFSFCYVPEPLAVAYETNSKDFNRDLMKTIGHRIVIIKNWRDLRKRPKLLSVHLTLIGSNLCSLGDLTEGRSYLLEALRRYPLKIVPALLIVLNTSYLRRVKELLGDSILNKALAFSYYPRPL